MQTPCGWPLQQSSQSDIICGLSGQAPSTKVNHADRNPETLSQTSSPHTNQSSQALCLSVKPWLSGSLPEAPVTPMQSHRMWQEPVEEPKSILDLQSPDLRAKDSYKLDCLRYCDRNKKQTSR